MEEIRITCQAADTLTVDQLLEFQGKIKTLTDRKRGDLQSSILEKGFCVPVFIWKLITEDEEKNFLLDGHQRLKTLLWMRETGYAIPPLPVVYIEADNEKDAREKLLVITSQYGEFDLNELDKFMDGIDDKIKNCMSIKGLDYKIKNAVPVKSGLPTNCVIIGELKENVENTLLNESINKIKKSFNSLGSFFVWVNKTL
jgi:hypothetical protein